MKECVVIVSVVKIHQQRARWQDVSVNRVLLSLNRGKCTVMYNGEL
ncbi:hypothetical protein [Chitinophaga sp.]|nr:hypothetical protein [Chitinophaga sp.]